MHTHTLTHTQTASLKRLSSAVTNPSPCQAHSAHEHLWVPALLPTTALGQMGSDLEKRGRSRGLPGDSPPIPQWLCHEEAHEAMGHRLRLGEPLLVNWTGRETGGSDVRMPRPSAATLSFLHQLQATASSGLLGISTYGGRGRGSDPQASHTQGV